MFKIMLIEDDLDYAESLKLFLRRDGCEVRVTGSAEEGLAEIALNKPDLVVVDVLLPGMDGTEICRHLQEDERFKDIPVIILTNVQQKLGYRFDEEDRSWVPAAEVLYKDMAFEEIAKVIDRYRGGGNYVHHTYH